ncbi:hypothetical protein RB595_007867 [Gaeumannomyces hyphopodioides]
MQQAARAVAVENRRLRDLLAAYGVPQAEVDEYARTGVFGHVPPEGVLPTPPPEPPLQFRRQSKQQQLAPMKQQIAPVAVLAPAPTSDCGTGSPPNRRGQAKKTCGPQPAPVVRQNLQLAPLPNYNDVVSLKCGGNTKETCKPQPISASPAPGCGPGASSSCGGGKKITCGLPRLDTTALPAITSAPVAVAPSCGSVEPPQCGEAKQQTCEPLTPCSPDRSAAGSTGPSDVAVPSLIRRAADVAAVPAAGQSGGTKRKLEEACSGDPGGEDAQQSGGSSSKRLNCEQPLLSPADTVKTCYPRVQTPAKCMLPSDRPLEGEPSTTALEPATCCGPEVCGVPVTVEVEPRHPAPPPPPQVSCCSTLPSEAISCCGADTDVPLQARSVFQTACEDAAALLMGRRGDNADTTDCLEIRSALGCVGPGTCQVKYTTVLELLDKFTI